MDRAVDPNYGPGMIGFSYRDNSVVSRGIAWFTQEEHDRIVPSHTFIVRDKTKLVEAHFPEVREAELSEYFDNPHIVVFFKKPKELTIKEIDVLVFNALLHLGRKYDVGSYGYYLVRKLLRLLGRFEPNKDKPSKFNSPEAWVCSELVSHCLKMVPKYANLFPLSEYHPSKIDPVMLFRSEELFQPWSFDV
jgi:hypothetical protein